MKAWITKYALTQGIFTIEAERTEFPRMISDLNDQLANYHKPFWHETKEEALIQARKMKSAKIVALKKQLAQIEAMKF